MSTQIFAIAYLIGMVIAGVIRLPAAQQYKQNAIAYNHKNVWELPLAILWFVGSQVLPLIYVLTPWLDLAEYPLPVVFCWLGIIVFIAGLWLLWRSHADLGSNWSPSLQIQQTHSLITEGVYRHIRHPMYAAHWLWGVAQPLLIHNWIAGCFGLLTFSLFYWARIGREEQMMVEQFGEAYRVYMEKTGGIIPVFWRWVKDGDSPNKSLPS